MSVCNGVNTKKFSRKRTQPSRLGESKTHIEEKDIAFEIFRGFEKKPVVVVPRYDITPFLNKSRKTINTRNLRTNNTVVQAKNVASLIKFVKDCSVRVASHDLRKLQGSLSIQSPRSDISESNADEEMGHLRCKICEKVYSSEKKLQNHQQNKHMIVYRPEKKPQKKMREKEKAKGKIKTTYKVGEKIPEYMMPSIVLEKISIGGKVLEDTIDFVDVNNFDIHHGLIKKAIVDPKSKKTLLSKHQCPTCHKYFSSRYCMNRHIENVHHANRDYENLRCKVCEEIFVWPSLLQSHKCIRSFIPEMPFEDARSEIHFDNLHEITQNGIDDFNITDHEDYINSVDFEIPAPIVTLSECDEQYIPNDNPIQNLGYKVIMQEVPIEF
ncbi:uncharacterized protein LOC128682029 isoform X2 [Plodia interpunctella]|uniref:uncharacterized protein LOC128682029 isoform X2 n=1 Tax=Plodia interpunctella TaxID=58824 RepID=UPI0023689178|nr:uncharacterized protein LOC128682029 isoform X2 [Plodia interpunctella]